MTRKQIEELFSDSDEPLMFMDGYDDCIVGVVERFGLAPIVCYDKALIFAKLIADGMTPEEADEWYGFNQLGAWIGNSTPCFLMQ